MKIKVLFITILLFYSFFSCKNQNITTQRTNQFDIVIYGGTSAGIAAAIQASRMGHSVILIEPTNRIGGLTTGGLGQTDFGNKMIIGGISKEFYQGIKAYYAIPANWNGSNDRNTSIMASPLTRRMMPCGFLSLRLL